MVYVEFAAFAAAGAKATLTLAGRASAVRSLAAVTFPFRTDFAAGFSVRVSVTGLTTT